MYPSSVIRKLAPSEEFFAQTETFTAVTVFLNGTVDLDALSMAFDILLEVYPVYAGHLEPDADGQFQIVVDDLLHPGMWVVEEGEAGRSSAMPLDQSVSLLNLMVKNDGAQDELTLFVHHALADGHHIAGLLFELFSRYTAVVTTGTPGSAIAEPVPQSIESVLAERGIHKQRRSGLDRFIPAMFTYELPPRRSVGWSRPEAPLPVPAARGKLTREETAALVKFGRKNRLFLNSLVSAAILLAEWHLRETPYIPIPYLCPVNLRALVEPPVTPTGCTLALGVSTYLAQITAETTLVDLARDIADTLQADLADGVIQQSMLHFSLQYEEIPGLPDAVIFTNIGNVSAMPTPPGLELVGFRSDFHRASAGVVDIYSSGVAAGQLHVEHHVQHGDPAESIELILSLLRAAVPERMAS